MVDFSTEPKRFAGFMFTAAGSVMLFLGVKSLVPPEWETATLFFVGIICLFAGAKLLSVKS